MLRFGTCVIRRSPAKQCIGPIAVQADPLTDNIQHLPNRDANAVVEVGIECHGDSASAFRNGATARPSRRELPLERADEACFNRRQTDFTIPLCPTPVTNRESARSVVTVLRR